MLVRQDDDEYQAAVLVKQAKVEQLEAQLRALLGEPRQQNIEAARAEYEKARVEARAAQARVERLEPAYRGGSIPEADYRDALTKRDSARKDEQGAHAKLESLEAEPVTAKAADLRAQLRAARAEASQAKADLDNCVLVARTDGVICGLTAVPGLLGRPGVAIWGRVIDLSTIDVRGELSRAQAQRIVVGQSASVLDEADTYLGKGRVIVIGQIADTSTGGLPVIVRLANTQPQLPSGVAVRLSLSTAAAEKSR